MNTGSMLMIHEAWTFAIGNKSDIEKTLNSLKGVDKSIVDIYMTRFKGERSEIETMLQNETWFTSDEAVDIGLADRVNEVVKDDDTAPEEYKNSVLQRFRAHKVHQEHLSFYLIGKQNIAKYDVAIVATSQEQAKTSFLG